MSDFGFIVHSNDCKRYSISNEQNYKTMLTEGYV